MKTLITLSIVLLTFVSFGQKKGQAPLNLKNALIIGQIDTPEDRYSLEINMTDLFGRAKVKSVPSLNVLKLGTDAQTLASDSMMQVVKAKGIDTYALISIRGYDKRYKVSNISDDFETALGQASFFDLYREGIVSVAFQFKFFRNGKCVHAEVIKCGNVGGRDAVLKKLRKRVGKKLKKKWR